MSHLAKWLLVNLDGGKIADNSFTLHWLFSIFQNIEGSLFLSGLIQAIIFRVHVALWFFQSSDTSLKEQVQTFLYDCMLYGKR